MKKYQTIPIIRDYHDGVAAQRTRAINGMAEIVEWAKRCGSIILPKQFFEFKHMNGFVRTDFATSDNMFVDAVMLFNKYNDECVSFLHGTNSDTSHMYRLAGYYVLSVPNKLLCDLFKRHKSNPSIFYESLWDGRVWRPWHIRDLSTQRPNCTAFHESLLIDGSFDGILSPLSAEYFARKRQDFCVDDLVNLVRHCADKDTVACVAKRLRVPAKLNHVVKAMRSHCTSFKRYSAIFKMLQPSF